ncbi:O-antigen polymerase [Hydrogenimonas urashimensis]|uniref:O-antigen polymerase n=1 Tax=Hydrogenimonas urashimensis TaxID=2740515 RepID=UPI001916C28F|nr:O-antigen polymerase [Hydrogenimonas urashimensis]
MGFSLGIICGVLYFIFIPVVVFVFTEKIEIFTIDFSNTNLTDVNLSTNIYTSLILMAYLYSILIYIFFSEFYKKERIHYFFNNPSVNWKFYFSISIFLGFIIFLAAGIMEGGNWYVSREEFFKKSGILGLILIDSFAAMKILFIASLIYEYYIYKKLSTIIFITIIFLFSVIDIIMTGNRIYVFVVFAIVFIELIKAYAGKILWIIVALIPFGYMMSIYRHIRGNLFIEGLPTGSDLFRLIQETIEKEPPAIKNFLLGISESVNFNVLYEIFHHTTFQNALWGSTFIKTVVFFIPRSLWPDKPLSITQVAGKYFAPQAEHLSLVTTLIGEVHMNFYFFGIVFLPFILIFTKFLLEKLFNQNNFTQILLFIFGLLIFRMPYSDILLLSFFVLFYYKFILIIKKFGVQII